MKIHTKGLRAVVAATIHDEEALVETIEIDTEADRLWFEQHPGCLMRTRPATVRELRAMGHPPGTEVDVILGPDGNQTRGYVLPR